MDPGMGVLKLQKDMGGAEGGVGVGGAGEMMAWRHEQSDVSGAAPRRGATQLLLKNHPPGATETRYFTEFAKVYDYAASDI